MKRIFTALAALAAFAAPASAQVHLLEGTVVDTAGQALADQVVVLHTVTAEGGMPLGSDTTDAAGRFTLALPGGLDAEAVAFAAVRLDGRLFLGPMLPGGAPPQEPYVITAGGESPLDGLGTAAPGAPPQASAAPEARTPLAWLVFVPLLALLGYFGFRALGDPGSERRRLLAELAAVEERRIAERLDAETREELEARRTALRDRLVRRPAAEHGSAA